ncbi:MAG: hypothetical protein M1829_004023 [Trizodia sp. TS-e1964]|nr:MAG: hypothetical protein M1829_004023 [Trizodia sp. TS-e1964]
MKSSSAAMSMAFSLLASGASASANLRLVERTNGPVSPPCTYPFAPWSYSGCYTDPSVPRALSFDTQLPQDGMTVELCIATCKANGYRYAGLEYYFQCFCGESINGPPAPQSECNYACTGNSAETCGGFDRVSIYQDPTAPVIDAAVASLNYKSQGCYTEGTNGRALVYRQDQVPASTLTTELCLAACALGGYPWAGTEYGGEW